MQELIDQLKEKAGLTDEQAIKSIEAIKDFVKEKFPEKILSILKTNHCLP